MGSLTKLLPECLGLLLVIPILISLAYLWPQVARNRSRTALSLALVTLLGVIHQAMFRTRAEDAFITFRYALNLATGKGVVFNPGEHVEGYSNFLFLVVLAGLKGGKEVPLRTDLIINRALTVIGAFGVDARAYAEAIRIIESRRFPLEKLH